MGLSNELSCEVGSFSCCRLNPHRCFQSQVLRLYFPVLGPWVAWSVSLPSSFSWFIHTWMWDWPVCQPLPLLPWSSSRRPAARLLCPAALLPVWKNVPSLTPWLLDFHTVRFSGSSGYFLSFKLLLSSFWLCEEAQCVYLRLHLGWKSEHVSFSLIYSHLAKVSVIFLVLSTWSLFCHLEKSLLIYLCSRDRR